MVLMVYINELEVIDIPDDQWLTRLRTGHFVWNPKEFQFAKIEWAWEPPDPGCRSGHLGLLPVWRTNYEWGTEHCERWFIFPDGSGFDGTQLLLPVRGNCPDDPTPISETWQRQTQRVLGQLLHRMESLETAINDRPDRPQILYPGDD